MKLVPDMAWPPLAPQIARAYDEWDAWYRGDPVALDRVYSAASRTGWMGRPSQYAGGLVGGAARMLWGNPPQDSTRDRRIHLPLAADIASASADLLFGEEVGVTWGDKGGKLSDHMATVLDGIGWQSLLPEAGEVAAAMGGVYLRAAWDADIAQHPLASIIPADGAIPTFAWGHLREVTFWRVIESDGSKIVRHLETHEPGYIRHSVWVGDTAKLGRIASLADFEATREIASSLDAEDYVATGITDLTAAYIPNVRPAALWRHVPSGQHLGRSDFGSQGVLGLFDAIDETWTSWMRDIRHGKSRIMAAKSALESLGPGQGQMFDMDREVYEALNVPPGQDPRLSEMVQAHQFAIRVEEHSRTIREATLAAVNSCGYSGSTFGIDTDVAKTATEVGAVRARTAQTREKKSRYWTTGLERFLAMFAHLDAVKFGGPGALAEPKVEFPASSSPTLVELAQVAQAMRAAEAASTDTLVRLLHPDWDDAQVVAEVDLIAGDRPAPTVIGLDPTLADPAAQQGPQAANPTADPYSLIP